MVPKENSKFEAQYLFGKDSINMVLRMIKDSGMDSIICIGAPRIHEAIRSICKGKIKSLMLDIDSRYVRTKLLYFILVFYIISQ